MDDQHDPRRAIRRLNLIGFTLVAVLGGGFAVWATTSELSGAVIAPGSIVVESTVKKVQHPTGGIVGEILVKEGAEVAEGQLLVRLDDTVARSTLGVLRAQLDELINRQARLLAERDGADEVTFPDELEARREQRSVVTARVGEQRLFEARWNARRGQRAQLGERVAQSNEEIRGLSAQLEAKENEIAFLTEELAGASSLYAKNLVTIMRYMQLKRDHARLHGERGNLIAEIARAQGKISETKLQIIQIDQDFRTEVLKDLRETQGKIAELKERAIAAEDQLRRVDIRAPLAGVVYQLGVHTIGGVIKDGETIMQIVPRAALLVVEAKVAPQDIDQVTPGSAAMIRIMAGNQRTTMDLEGIVVHVSPDLTREQPAPGSSAAQPQQAQAYYMVRLSLPESEVARLGDLRLVPGMPAEAFIRTSERTPLQYLLKPLREQITRTFRER